jgi:serine/threonine-protein kinase
MIRLLVLGGIALRNAAGAECRSVTAQPKRIALLAYLAIAGRQTPIRRDTILALFWPELDTERSRHALRQSLYHIRRELGNEVVRGNGDDELNINLDALSCDATDFYRALSVGAREAALDHYNGDLLPGLHIGGAPDFDQWVEVERGRIRDHAHQAAVALCAEAERRGEKLNAVRWARRAHQIVPFDEVTLRRLVELLDAAGEGPGAIMAFETYADRLERDLGLAPSAETIAVIKDIRARGRTPPTRKRRGPPAIVSPPAPSMATIRGAARAAVIPVLLIILGVGAAIWPRLQQSVSPGDESVIAIMPFHTIGASTDSVLLAEGIPELLTLNLQTHAGPRVVDSRVVRARWRRATLRANATTALAREVARSAGAGLVVEGTALRRDSTIVISARLLNVRSGAVLAKSLVESPSTDLVRSVTRLSANMMGTVLREDPRRLDLLANTPYDAVQHYLEGKAAARRGDHDRALVNLRRALEIDSTFALAALSLVDVVGWAGRQNEQPLYEQIAHSHRDQLGPRDALYLRAWTGQPVFPGQHPAGSLIEATEEAVAAMPDRPEALYMLGDRYYHRGEWEQISDAPRRSRTLMERARSLDPDFGPAREHLVELALLTRDAPAVRRELDLILEKEAGARRTPYIRWLAAQYLHDVGEQRRMRAALDTMNAQALSLIVQAAQEHAFGVDDAEHAARLRIDRAATEPELNAAKVQLEILLRNCGRHQAADSLRPLAAQPQTPTRELVRRLRFGMFADVPTENVMPAFQELVRRTRQPAQTDSQRIEQRRTVFATELWRLWHGDTTHTSTSLAALLAAGREPDQEATVMAATVRAMLEHLQASADRRAQRPALETLDSLTRYAVLDLVPQMVMLRILRENGMAQRGLKLSRQRLRGTGPTINVSARLYREEGWFAAALGDRAAASEAYRKYLALRAQSDPALQASVDSIRVQYQQLTRRRWLHAVIARFR